MAKYTVRKIRTFRGREGNGFNAELMLDGIPVAFVIDEANGGDYRYEWYDRERTAFTYTTGDGTNVTVDRPKGEVALREHIKDMTFDFGDLKGAMTPDLFVSGLVDNHANDAIMKRTCKTRTCFRLKGQEDGKYMVMPLVFTAEIAAKVRREYGDRLDFIYNEKLKEA